MESTLASSRSLRLIIINGYFEHQNMLTVQLQSICVEIIVVIYLQFWVYKKLCFHNYLLTLPTQCTHYAPMFVRVRTAVCSQPMLKFGPFLLGKNWTIHHHLQSVSSCSFSLLCRAMGREFSSVSSWGFSLLCRVFIVMGGAFTIAKEQNLPPFLEYFTQKELCITFWCRIINWCKWGNAEK